MLATFVFWTSIVLLCYVYAGYPLLIHLWARLRPRPWRRGAVAPRVSLLVVAHNEADRIVRRVENLLSLRYPADRLEILVGSDGSTDDTVVLARGFTDRRLRVFDFPVRRGKAAVLNELASRARGEIMVMADARQRFAVDALAELVRPFADASVGAVSGELVLTSGAEGSAMSEGVGFYWRYEKFIRSSESLVDSSVGATGAIYAIRRELFEPLPDDTILDDVLIPMRVVAGGYRVLFEPRARAWDRAAATAREEFVRKVRTIAGNFQLLSREPWLLNPNRNRIWFQTLSHKGLRLLGPGLFIGAFWANLELLGTPLYRLTFAAQTLFYLAALEGFLLRDARRRIRLLMVPYTVCLLNWATAVAFYRFVTGRQQVSWERALPAAIQAPAVSREGRAVTRRSA
jgi:cellulose synthase/poly-beta-1,6-N-acetylglucosamine synthase-like glycosyltransferase